MRRAATSAAGLVYINAEAVLYTSENISESLDMGPEGCLQAEVISEKLKSYVLGPKKSCSTSSAYTFVIHCEASHLHGDSSII